MIREPVLALGLLLLFAAAAWVWIAARRSRVVRAGGSDLVEIYNLGRRAALVLAFSTPDCALCKTVQRPALEDLERRFPGRVVVREIDALEAPALADRFGIFTVPSTVVIAPDGSVRAVNSGATTAERLAAQIGVNRLSEQ
jgi:hypothetical protein